MSFPSGPGFHGGPEHPGAPGGFPPASGQLPMQVIPGLDYEFTPDQNALIGDLAKWLNLLAVMLFFSAIGQLGNPQQWIGAAFNIYYGVMMLGASKLFKQVVDTQGNDVPNLLGALTKFGSVMRLRAILSIIFLVLLVTVVAAITVLRVAGGSR